MISGASRLVIASICTFVYLLGAPIVWAEDAVPFYKGKTISMIIGYPPGGGFDSSARLLLRYMARHIPGNPTIVPRNMPGAASLIATNYLYNVAPKDGTEFGLIGGSVPFGPLWSRAGVKFDALKFNWIGSMDRWDGIVLIWAKAPITTLDQALNHEVTLGATGSGDVTAIYPRVINKLIGTKFKIVGGYQGSSDLNLAIQRGEVSGRAGWCWDCLKAEKPDWVARKEVKIMLQLGFTKAPELAKVPLLMDLVKSDDDRAIVKMVFGSQEMARPFVAPPGVPHERMAVLRRAFVATLNDTDFLAEARRIKLPVKYTSSQDIEKLLGDVYKIPQPVVDRAAKMVQGG